MDDITDDPVQQPPRGSVSSHPYTCLSCGLAFTTAQTQRAHYSTELHRYNSKRSIAGLSPIDLETFNLKFNQTSPNDHHHHHPHEDTAHRPRQEDPSRHQAIWRCEPCRKTFNSQGAHSNHLTSKRHKEIILPTSSAHRTKRSSNKPQPNHPSPPPDPIQFDGFLQAKVDLDSNPKNNASSSNLIHQTTKPGLDSIIQLRYQHAPKINPNECLFCPRSDSIKFPNEEEALKHMLVAHGFFLPDQEYLTDRLGLLNYLADSISVWNVCLYCSTGFGGKIQSDHSPQDHTLLTRRGLESVRKHMCDKNHCKLPWDTEEQRLEYADFFDYRSSYKKPSNHHSISKRKSIKSLTSGIVDDDEWEDLSNQSVGDADESMGSNADDDQDSLPDSRSVSLGDSPFEIVLPNGVRLGHRSLKYIYKQNLLPYSVGSQSTQAGNRNMNLITKLAILSSNQTPNDDAARVDQSKSLCHRFESSAPVVKISKLSLANSSLIPSRGAGLNFNSNRSNQNPLELVMRARNRGEAKQAGKHVRTFNDVRVKQNFRDRVACTSGNNQKHYRDPLLQ